MRKNIALAVAAAMGANMRFNAGIGPTPNKYQPHQGKREIARRLRSSTPRTPSRVWVMDCSVFGDGSSMYESRKRSSLAHLHFHRKLNRIITLERKPA